VEPDFSSATLKIRRAQTHLADLQRSISDTLDPTRYRLEVERDPQAGEDVYTVHDIPKIDPNWQVIVGEVLFNLRSALDHIAWQLVLLDGGEPGEQTQFPIRDTPFTQKGELVRANTQPPIKGAKLLAALDEAQPYNGVDGDPRYIHMHGLWRLRLLHNWDKHRLLLLVVHVLNTGRIYWGANEDDPTPKLRFNTGPLKDGSPAAWFDFGGAERPPHFNPNLTLTVAIDEPLTTDGKRSRLGPLFPVLDSVLWWIKHMTFEHDLLAALPTACLATGPHRLPPLTPWLQHE
jgi:hypothetical protein